MIKRRCGMRMHAIDEVGLITVAVSPTNHLEGVDDGLIGAPVELALYELKRDDIGCYECYEERDAENDGDAEGCADKQPIHALYSRCAEPCVSAAGQRACRL